MDNESLIKLYLFNGVEGQAEDKIKQHITADQTELPKEEIL